MEFDSHRRGRPASAVRRSTASTAPTACFMWNILCVRTVILGSMWLAANGSQFVHFVHSFCSLNRSPVCRLQRQHWVSQQTYWKPWCATRVAFHEQQILYHGAWSFRLFIFKWPDAKTTSFDKMISSMAQLCIDLRFSIFCTVLSSTRDTWERSPRSLSIQTQSTSKGIGRENQTWCKNLEQWHDSYFYTTFFGAEQSPESWLNLVDKKYLSSVPSLSLNIQRQAQSKLPRVRLLVVWSWIVQGGTRELGNTQGQGERAWNLMKFSWKNGDEQANKLMSLQRKFKVYKEIRASTWEETLLAGRPSMWARSVKFVWFENESRMTCNIVPSQADLNLSSTSSLKWHRVESTLATQWNSSLF